jgi:hypothetical protein
MGRDHRRIRPPAESHPRHLASLAPYRPGPPAPFRHVAGSPDLGLLRGLRRLGVRARQAIPLSHHADVRARVRCPVRPLQPPDGGRSPLRKAAEVVSSYLGSRESAPQAWCAGSVFEAAGDWGSSDPAFTMSCGPGGAAPYTPSDVPRFDGRLWSPSGFRRGVSRWPDGTSFRTIPACGRNQHDDETAHRNDTDFRPFCVPTLNILAFAGYRGRALRRIGKPNPFLDGFQPVGWMAVITYLLWCWILPEQASWAFAFATEQVYWLTLDHLKFDTMKYHDPTFRLAWRISKATQGIIASGMLTSVIMFAATCGGIFRRRVGGNAPETTDGAGPTPTSPTRQRGSFTRCRKDLQRPSLALRASMAPSVIRVRELLPVALPSVAAAVGALQAYPPNVKPVGVPRG